MTLAVWGELAHGVNIAKEVKKAVRVSHVVNSKEPIFEIVGGNTEDLEKLHKKGLGSNVKIVKK